MASVFQDLSDQDIGKIRALGTAACYSSGESIFNEGERADFLYLIESGAVSLFIEKFNTQSEIQQAQAGDWFGEVAAYSRGYRTASAKSINNTCLLKVAVDDFHSLLAREPGIAQVLDSVVDERNCHLVLQEKLLDMAGYNGQDLHIGIKGDPSLRESAMERARYDSVVDKNLAQLMACFEDLLINRIAHRIMIGFNNGEIRISTLLDPFSEEFHPALRLLDASYVDRHFPRIAYADKAESIRRLYQAIGSTAYFGTLPHYLKHGFEDYYHNWSPVPVETIPGIVAQLPQLRAISNYYARSATISIVKDAIQMQFNCDGSHILSTKGFHRFVEENL